MRYQDVFKMPVRGTITGRSSTITNAFVGSIIPRVQPIEAEIEECLQILGLDPNELRCVYCGRQATEWDHFHPLVSGKKPTGYISEIRNLVPACGTCNQSKRNKNWKEWIKKCSRTDQIEGLNARINRLEKYEKWGQVSPVKLEKLLDKKLWDQHWQNCEDLHRRMKSCQILANQIKTDLEKKLQPR